jgi:uncharacterized protein YggT (Ycf19 family)
METQLVVYNLVTLYMLLLVLRWVGAALGFELDSGRWRWIGRVTDPLVRGVRQVVPPLGPFDFAPVGTIIVVWLARSIAMVMLQT